MPAHPPARPPRPPACLPACLQHKDVLESSLAQLKSENERNISDVRRIRQREVLLKEVRLRRRCMPVWPQLRHVWPQSPAAASCQLPAATRCLVCWLLGLPCLASTPGVNHSCLPACLAFALLWRHAGGGDARPGALGGV